jgi:hypothetical protein
MKRFRDLFINCTSHNEALALLHIIENECNSEPFVFSEDVRSQYMSDESMTHILSSVSGTPRSVLVLFARDKTLKVINIVPYMHSVSSIDKDDYNRIVEEFGRKITPLCEGDHYRIVISPAEYRIQDLIPLSFQALDLWVHCPAPQAPFLHPSDLHLWFDFLIALVENNEQLMSGDLELWLREEMKWSEELIEETILHFEHDKELLKYFNEHSR